MGLSFTIFSALLSALTAWLLVRPHLTANNLGRDTVPASDASDNIDREERSHQMLRDLELDFATGKISEKERNLQRTALEKDLKRMRANPEISFRR